MVIQRKSAYCFIVKLLDLISIISLIYQILIQNNRICPRSAVSHEVHVSPICMPNKLASPSNFFIISFGFDILRGRNNFLLVLTTLHWFSWPKYRKPASWLLWLTQHICRHSKAIGNSHISGDTHRLPHPNCCAQDFMAL